MSSGTFRERVRVRFARRGAVRFLSHLDMMRLFERALRRAGLPLRLSEGYNRRPRLSFPVPLSVGWEACDEVMEFDLGDWVRAAEVRRALERELPPGVEVGAVTLVESRGRARPVEAEYTVRAVEAAGAEAPRPERVARFLERTQCPVRRLRKGKWKEADIRPFVKAIEREGDTLHMRMALSPAGTAKPEEVLRAMGIADAAVRCGFRIVRRRVRLRGEGP